MATDTAITNRYYWADFLRGFLMILVVIYHSESYYYTGYNWSWIFQPIFLTGFFFVSGFLFCRDISEVSLKKKTKQVFRGIIFPYFCFMLLMALPKLLLGRAESSQLLIDILMMRASWFVIAVGVMQILYAVLLYISPTYKSLLIGTALMFAVGYALVIMYRNPPEWLIANPWLHSNELPNRLPFCINLALVQSPFFLFGILYRQYEHLLDKYMTKRNFVILSLLFAVLGGADYVFIGSYIVVAMDRYNNILLIYFYAIIGIWALLCLSYRVKRWKPLNYIGRHSILFYFLNGGALTITALILRKIPNLESDSFVGQFLCVILAVCFLYAFTWAIVRWLPILTGDRSAFNKWSARIGLNVRW